MTKQVNIFIPSFIDLYSNFGIKKAERSSSRGRSSQYNPNRKGFYWNDHILSDYNSINDYSYNLVKSKKLREAGFGIVNTHRENGIHRGTGSLIALSDRHTDNYRIIKSKSTEFYSFKKSINSAQSYPTSVMGAMALLRQFFLDIKWYEQKNPIPRISQSKQPFKTKIYLKFLIAAEDLI